MSLRIAFDCDGVLADMESALEALATSLFGPSAEPPAPEAARPDTGLTPGAARRDGSSADTAHDGGDPSTAATEAAGADADITPEEEQLEPARVRQLTRKQQHDIWEAVKKTENFWETLQETEPGIVARLAQIADERGWEVIFVTQRPASAGATTQRQTQRWLVSHGFELPAVYVTKGSRGKVAEALSLDVLVDDRPENCLDVKLESRARAILVWNGDPSSVPPNARRMGIEPVAGIGACLDLLTAAPPAKPGLLSRLKKLVGA
jgi:hypothetical protein